MRDVQVCDNCCEQAITLIILPRPGHLCNGDVTSTEKSVRVQSNH